MFRSYWPMIPFHPQYRYLAIYGISDAATARAAWAKADAVGRAAAALAWSSGGAGCRWSGKWRAGGLGVTLSSHWCFCSGAAIRLSTSLITAWASRPVAKSRASSAASTTFPA
jgi:hypothetical protein